MKIKNNDMNDPFTTLFTSEEISSPKPGFTSGVMGKIAELESAPAIAGKTNETLYTWLYSIAGFVSIITILILLSNFGYIQILPENFEFTLLPIFKNVILNFRDIFSSFKLSSTTISILAALSAIVIFERLLRRISLSKNTHLISL